MVQYKIHMVPLVPTYQLRRPVYHWNFQNQLYGVLKTFFKRYFGDLLKFVVTVTEHKYCNSIERFSELDQLFYLCFTAKEPVRV